MKIFQSAFAEQMEKFIVYKEAHGHKRKSYETELSLFDEYCIATHPNTVYLSKECVMGFAKIMQNETRSRFNRRMRVLKQFGEFMALVSPPAYVLPPKFITEKSSFTPYLFTDDELKRLFRASDRLNPSSQNPFRAAVFPVLFRLIYTCGLRPGEGRLLKKHNVNLKTGEILIEASKQHKDRIVVMSEDMLSLYMDYLKKRDVLFPHSEYVFPDPNGQPYKSNQLLKIFKRCFKNSNPELSQEQLPSVRVYDLRHRFATATIHKWMSEGKDVAAMLPYLRTYMGHENFNETLYYIHLLPENLAKVVQTSSLTEVIPEVSL